MLGDELVIVSLTMSMEERRQRVLARHSGDKAAADMMDVSLPVISRRTECIL